MGEEKFGGDLSKRILKSIKPFSGEETNKWLAALSNDSADQLVPIGNDPDSLFQQEEARSMTVWMDTLFDQFQRYAFDFSNMCDEPQLQVNCSRPAVQEIKPPGKEETTVTSMGYLSTQSWAMVIRGEQTKDAKIQAFVIPIGILMGFTARFKEYPAYMEMSQGVQNRNKFIWILDNQPVLFEQSPSIAKRLFAHLVMVARGEAKDTDRFSFLPPRPIVLPPKPGGGDGSKVELMKPEWLLKEEPLPPQAPPRGMPAQVLRNSQPPANMVPPQMPPLPPGARPTQPVVPEKPLSSMDEQLKQNLQMVLNDCNQFCEAIDTHLVVLTSLGVKAIQTQDMDSASQIMQRAKRLKHLLENMVRFTEELDNSSRK